MANTRFTDGWSPARPHLARSNELSDLRADVEGAFQKVANELSGFLYVEMTSIVAPGSGIGVATVGFKVLVSPGGAAYEEEIILQLGAFDNVDAAGVGAATATLATATKGTILWGSGTSVILVKTNATGEFECQLTNPADETNYLTTAMSFKSPALDSRSMSDVTFIP